MRKMFLAALIGGTALVLAACGEENGESKVRNAAGETAKAVDRTADHAVGKAQLEQKKKMENKLNQLQQNQNKQLDKALKN